ncbi:hypothetical protein [Gellertiella hungarica]|uniref:Uncharacterized protein n=1 Tax=Gellertiella hungarica TaxID=1572859 RepID=A0A7W6J798_9HYPH|nr:hypothetical protein [Gellertiella hungarica]MBB4066120.1 hypothetical protein [Gellertiella hungarica]
MDKDKQAQEAIEETAVPAKKADSPPAGPHAEEKLTDGMKTPGTGLLPDKDDGGDVSAASG